ncbi:uncharacterized protein LOC135820090 [Sycon ciliatum]|uniref:uncharacterized protein LOC135820090 n=1 Tax=Sycon ciliatum TaxID=27933 RepID=UPI0031F6A9EA
MKNYYIGSKRMDLHPLWSFVGLVLASAISSIVVSIWIVNRLRKEALPSTQSSPQCVPESRTSASQPAPRDRPHVKEPPVFTGDPTTFREWAFAVELALASWRFADPKREAEFAASYIAGNPRLWLMTSLEAGAAYPDWSSLKKALEAAYGVKYDQERARWSLFSLSQRGALGDYIAEFSRLSFLITDLDGHSRAVLFVRGLAPELRREVMKEHPTTLQKATEAALAVSQVMPFITVRQQQGNLVRRPLSVPGPRSNREETERRCYICHRPGHLARQCDSNPNAGRQ